MKSLFLFWIIIPAIMGWWQNLFLREVAINKAFKPGAIWADTDGKHINAHGGGILFYQGKYYWFGEHKTAGKGGNRAQVGISCYSSTDFYNWKNEGIALPVAPENSGSEIEKGCVIERPKVVYNARTKKFVMWFHLELKGQGYNDALTAVGEGAESNFQSQSTFVLPVAGKKDAFVFMADRWRPNNPIDGRYVWLPLTFENGKPVLRWQDEWKLNTFATASQ